MANRLQLIAAAGLAAIAIGAAHAGGAGMGALGGFGQALEDLADEQLRSDAAVEAQRKLLEQQHQQEMERMRLHFEQQQRAEQAQRQRGADVSSQMEAAHPGWVRTVQSRAFGAWKTKQPPRVQALGASNRPEDAILMLDLYKRDVPNWAAQQ